MTKNTNKIETVAPRQVTTRLAFLLRRPLVQRLFMAACATILFCTVLLWTMLAASLHQFNADQLINSYLFETHQIFAQAIFPGAHSFLLKWPIFALMQLFGSGANVFYAATLTIVLATVGALVYLLYRIEQRPYVFGVLCLALASILLLVPAQPYAGVLLPVNMAMTTTRNLEYIVFLLALWFASRVPKLESWPAIGTALIMTVLVASDKLFGVLAVGACLFAAFWYAVVLRKKGEALRALGWLLIVIVSIGAATVLLLALDGRVTGISNGDSASPYVVLTSIKQIAVATIFGFGAILTNFGANPVHAVIVLRDIPSALIERLKDPSIMAYLVNLVLFMLGVYSAVRLLIKRHWTAHEDAGKNLKWVRLSFLLIGATLVAAAIYVLTDHYYPVDARYLTIAVFAVAIAAATYWSSRRVDLRVLGILSLVIVAVIPLGMTRAVHEYSASKQVMAARIHLTNQVSVELDRHGVKRLVGDYWDVTPVKAAMAKPITVVPVDNCVVPRQVLTSKAWFEMPQNTPTAYLAVRDGSAEAGPDEPANTMTRNATYAGCSIQKLVGTYGVPVERVPIDAKAATEDSRPDALLLLYPNGIKTAEQAAAERKAAAQPEPPIRKNLTALSALADCKAGTSLQVVAHEDDDILFMNPDVLTSIRAGHCLRTVYLTAGNAGEDVNYWGGRESGAKAAYAAMFGVANDWQNEQQYVGDHKVTISYLAGVPRVSLVFLRLPDGNLKGEGFAGNQFASLQKLIQGSLPKIDAVDQTASYTKQELVDTLLAVMNADKASEIRTLGSNDQTDGDHADHHDAGLLTNEAAAAYTAAHTVTHYLGYPERKFPVNLADDVIIEKESIFLAYAKFDGAVCQSVTECLSTAYNTYVQRQYLATP